MTFHSTQSWPPKRPQQENLKKKGKIPKSPHEINNEKNASVSIVLVFWSENGSIYPRICRRTGPHCRSKLPFGVKGPPLHCRSSAGDYGPFVCGERLWPASWRTFLFRALWWSVCGGLGFSSLLGTLKEIRWKGCLLPRWTSVLGFLVEL